MVVVYLSYSLAMRRTDFWSGWTLFVLILFLALYNFRRKLPGLPLGSSAKWLQSHIYAGALTVVLFVLHTEIQIPNGSLERILALLFLLIAMSGIAGLVLSRVLARRLLTRGSEVMYEWIPTEQKRLRKKAEDLVIASTSAAESAEASLVLTKFYRQHLEEFFARPQNYLNHLLNSTHHLQELLGDKGLKGQDRYLSQQDQERARQLHALVLEKDGLDFHNAVQGTLKYWSFLHAPLTYSLLIVAVIHAILASAFSTG